MKHGPFKFETSLIILAMAVCCFFMTTASALAKEKIIIYQPSAPFAADFVGMKNLFSASVLKHEAVMNSLRLYIRSGRSEGRQIGIRPEHIHIQDTSASEKETNCFHGEILNIHPQGFYAEIAVDAARQTWRPVMLMTEVMQKNLSVGNKVFLTVSLNDVHVLQILRKSLSSD